jgi:hypothetical protein
MTAIFVPAVLLTAGCLVTTHEDKVIREDEPREAVVFESDEGMMQFHAAVNRRSDGGARDRGRSSFNIPFIVSANTRKVLSRTAFFNDQMRLADINADGTLSDAEVWAYDGR